MSIDMDFNANGALQALIKAAVNLKLRAQIKVSFFFAWAIPIALTGLAIPSHYNEIFFGSGSALAVTGVIALIASLFMP